MVVSSGINIIYVYQDESNVGDERNWVQTMRPKFHRQLCFNEAGNSLPIEYIVSKAICESLESISCKNNKVYLELRQQ